MVRRAELLRRAADARRLRRRRQDCRLPRQRHAGRHRRRGGARHLGPVACRVCHGRASMRGWTPGRRCCLRRARPTAGLRAALFVDQLDARVVPARGLLAARDRVCRDGLARLRNELQPARRRSARGIKSWGPHTFNLGVEGGSIARLGHAGVRVVHARRAAAPVRLPLNEFAGRAVRIRPTDVLQPHDSAAGSARDSGSMSAPRQKLAASAIGSTACRRREPCGRARVFLGADTFVGPLYLGVGVGAGRWSLYLLLGAP